MDNWTHKGEYDVWDLSRYCPKCYSDSMYAVAGLRHDTNYKCSDCKSISTLSQLKSKDEIKDILRDKLINKILNETNS